MLMVFYFKKGKEIKGVFFLSRAKSGRSSALVQVGARAPAAGPPPAQPAVPYRMRASKVQKGGRNKRAAGHRSVFTVCLYGSRLTPVDSVDPMRSGKNILFVKIILVLV